MDAKAEKIALFRYGLIAPLVLEPLPRGDPMVQAIWNALLVFDLLPTGFSNRNLRTNLAALRGQSEDQFTQGRMPYQLRRLRLHGLIEGIPKTHRYRVTDFGFRVAVFCTRTYARILRPAIGLVAGHLFAPMFVAAQFR